MAVLGEVLGQGWFWKSYFVKPSSLVDKLVSNLEEFTHPFRFDKQFLVNLITLETVDTIIVKQDFLSSEDGIRCWGEFTKWWFLGFLKYQGSNHVKLRENLPKDVI